MSPRAGSRTRKPATERRGEIAAATLRLLGRGGLSAVTAATVAAEVGVSPAALFRHFATLDAIVGAAVDLAVARLDPTLPPATGSPVARLRALAAARVRLLQEEPGIAWLLRSEQAASSLPAPAVEALRGAIARSRACIVAAVRQGVARGEFRADVPVAVLLTVFTATIHALVHRTGLGPRAAGRPDPDDVLPGLFRLLAVAPPEVPR